MGSFSSTWPGLGAEVSEDKEAGLNKPFPLPPHPDPTTCHWPWVPGPQGQELIGR